MARVLALTGDLLFGSQVQGALAAAGHDTQLIADLGQVRERLQDRSAGAVDVLVVDLVDVDLDGAGALESLCAAGALDGVRALAFYSHVDAAARERAERAGFDLIVARSRMAREGATLVSQLAGEDVNGVTRIAP
jgi:DNA-binding response OmpR family regulator